MKNRYQESTFNEESSSSGLIVNPPIPEGYKHVCGEWNNGFVIERIIDGSQFVWIPVRDLDADGTLDGKNFDQKLGRRFYPYLYETMTKIKYYSSSSHQITTYTLSKKGINSLCEIFEKALNDGLSDMVKSVEKYGGFYFSRYCISKSSESKPQSVKGAKPWMNYTGSLALEIASSFENNAVVTSHLMFKAERDSVLAWFLKSDPTYEFRKYLLGKLVDKVHPNRSDNILKTGSYEHPVNNVCDLLFNLNEWTYENVVHYWLLVYKYSRRKEDYFKQPDVFRGDLPTYNHLVYGDSLKLPYHPDDPGCGYTTQFASIHSSANAFRIVLCIK